MDDDDFVPKIEELTVPDENSQRVDEVSLTSKQRKDERNEHAHTHARADFT